MIIVITIKINDIICAFLMFTTFTICVSSVISWSGYGYSFGKISNSAKFFISL